MAMNDNTNSVPPISSVHPVSRTQLSNPRTQPPNTRAQSPNYRTQPLNPQRQPSGPPKPLTNSDPSKSSPPPHSLSMEEVQEALKYHAEDLFRLMFGRPKYAKASNWYSREKPSMSMCMQGEKRGLWYDSDSAKGGKLFDLVARKFLSLKWARDDFPKVLQEAARYCGITAGQPVDMRAIKARTIAREQQRQEAEPEYSFSAEEVQEALNDRAEDLFRLAFGEPVRTTAQEWRSRETSARGMRMQGPKRGQWYDFKSAEGGNLFDLVACEFLNLNSAKDNFPRVLEEAARYCGIRADQPIDTRIFKARAAEREELARKEAKRDKEQRMALVKDLLNRTVPITETTGHKTPSRAYLALRGITELPKTGLGDLPPVPGVAVAGAKFPALVVWARNSKGEITGGQRILIRPDGSKANVNPSKPAFGFIRGSIAQFPARTELTDKNAPLVIAEGPESALSIWQSTGYETWAVFGSQGWEHAPIPLNRPVILAPDRDAVGSPADQALYKAVLHHLVRGCNPRIAIAPEPKGSKRDLNDTLMRENGGAEMVRKAIENAIPIPVKMKEEAELHRQAQQQTGQHANQKVKREQPKQQVRREVNTPRHRTTDRGNEEAPSSDHHHDAGDGPGF